MKLGIMQPYFFPYIGYYQLINAVDEFVVYDNIEYTKKGWINRNRILVNGEDANITLPLKGDSDRLMIKDRYLASTWPHDRTKLINRIKNAYSKAPFFESVFSVIEEALLFDELNLFKFLINSITVVNKFLGIKTTLIISSTLAIDHSLKSQSKVIALCQHRNASVYINPIGGVDLYNKGDFANKGIDLQFLKSKEHKYAQFENQFVPWLSIIDVMMFNSKIQISEMLLKFSEA